MALENKYGKSAVDATRRNALPPYLDELFAGGIGGAGVETHDITLTTGGWSNLQQSVVLTCGATDASDVVCAANNTSMDSDYYMSAFGVSLSNVTVVEGEEEGQNTVTFTFTAVTVPTVNIDVVVVIINSDSSGASYLEELVDEANSSKNISMTKAAEAAASATNAQNSAETAAGIEALLQQLLTQYRDSVYPIGSIYMNVNNVNPSTLFGGTWEQIQDTFLLSAGSTYGGGTTGGASSISYTPGGTVGNHTLTINEMPSHGHRVRVWDNAGTTDNAWYYNGTTKTTHSGARLYAGSASSWISAGNTASAASSGMGDPSGTTDLVGGGGAHNHGFTGTAATLNNMPPYLAVYVWKRTA